MITEVFVELSRLNFLVAGRPNEFVSDYSEIKEEEDLDEEVSTSTKMPAPKSVLSEDDQFFKELKEKKKKNATLYYPCDKKSDLFVLQQDFAHGRGFSLDVPTNGSR